MIVSSQINDRFDSDIINLIRQRYSCRVCEKTAVPVEIRERLEVFSGLLTSGPFGTRLRFMVSAASGNDTEELKGLGTYGFIRNPAGFIIGMAEEGERNLEDFGYAMEILVLYATELGLGTCWLGGSFTRSSFSEKAALQKGEILPAVVSFGFATEESRSHLFRRIVRSDTRMGWEKLFFDGNPGQPLNKQSTGDYDILLEMVRLAPSSSNNQPWRIVKEAGNFHFYLQRKKSRKPGSALDRLLGILDLKRVDMGIAMCHFELAAKYAKLPGKWEMMDPGIDTGEHSWEYIASWHSVNPE